MWRQRVSSLAIWVVLYHTSDYDDDDDDDDYDNNNKVNIIDNRKFSAIKEPRRVIIPDKAIVMPADVDFLRNFCF